MSFLSYRKVLNVKKYIIIGLVVIVLLLAILYNKISEILENNIIPITNTILIDGFVYCKYSELKKSSSYLGNTYFITISISDEMITYVATSSYLNSIHSKYCSLDNPYECTSEDEVKEDNNFIIVNIDGSWKVREFHLYH